jgi:hypothetical protein
MHARGTTIVDSPDPDPPRPVGEGLGVGFIHLDRYGMRHAHPISRSLITAEFPAPPTWP